MSHAEPWQCAPSYSCTHDPPCAREQSQSPCFTFLSRQKMVIITTTIKEALLASWNSGGWKGPENDRRSRILRIRLESSSIYIYFWIKINLGLYLTNGQETFGSIVTTPSTGTLAYSTILFFKTHLNASHGEQQLAFGPTSAQHD